MASIYSVNAQTISRIWHRGQNSITDDNKCSNVSSRKKGNSGPKKQILDLSIIKDIPYNQRSNLRSLSFRTGFSTTTLWRRLQEGEMVRHTSFLRPYLTEKNRMVRLDYCLEMIDSDEPRFKDMMDYIHIDEKWFNLTTKSKKYYLLPSEEKPYRACKSTKFITKVMFLAAVARPRWNHSKNQWFDGKLGIWPFVEEVPAQRDSKNRQKGTLETKCVNVDRNTYKAFLIEKLLPAIVEKWPRNRSNSTIKIQQDNAKPHIATGDLEFLEAVRCTGLDITLVSQPPNSPDLNVLDLGFFHSIQTLQYQKPGKNVDELISNTIEAFDELDKKTLNAVFLTLQQCMTEVIKIRGGNKYKLPHMGKAKLERKGLLPECLSIDINILREIMDSIKIE